MTFSLLSLLLACSPSKDSAPVETTDSQDGACGAVSTHVVTVRAKVLVGGQPAAGLRVYLDDRGWEMKSVGEGNTGANGEVEFVADPVTSVENCWGTVLNYWIVAENTDGSTVEDDMNTELFNAIDDGSLVSDVTGFPLEF